MTHGQSVSGPVVVPVRNCGLFKSPSRDRWAVRVGTCRCSASREHQVVDGHDEETRRTESVCECAPVSAGETGLEGHRWESVIQPEVDVESDVNQMSM